MGLALPQWQQIPQRLVVNVCRRWKRHRARPDPAFNLSVWKWLHIYYIERTQHENWVTEDADNSEDHMSSLSEATGRVEKLCTAWHRRTSVLGLSQTCMLTQVICIPLHGLFQSLMGPPRLFPPPQKRVVCAVSATDNVSLQSLYLKWSIIAVVGVELVLESSACSSLKTFSLSICAAQ